MAHPISISDFGYWRSGEAWHCAIAFQNGKTRDTDTEGKIIFDRLSDNFASTLRQKLKDKATQTEIQALLADLLEEWKLNYIKGSYQRNPEETLAEAEKIKEQVS